MPTGGDGSVILEQAYALSKMLNNKSWHGLLRSGITPSDIDLPYIPVVFGSFARTILCDLSNSYRQWSEAPTGQHRLYRELTTSAPHIAVLCHHNVTPEMGRKIDTLYDIDSFQVMLEDFGFVYSKLFEADDWQPFVERWVNDPHGPQFIRRRLLGSWAKQNSPTTPASLQTAVAK